MEEVMRRGQALLTSGMAQDVKAEVQTMANFLLPLSQKYHHIKAETMLGENVAGSNKAEVLESLSRLVKALSILEKYGCNLTSPARPKYWRSVKHNNPVFKTTVDAIQGGRRVLFLYGYTNQQQDGLGFPDDVTEPDREKVAMVTLEVMTLRVELDMLMKGTHPHQEVFKDVVPFVVQQATMVTKVIPLEEKEPARKPPPPPVLSKPKLGLVKPQKTTSPSQCNLCGGPAAVVCPSCDNQAFCDACDDLFHRHPARTNHKRDRELKAMNDMCTICGVSPVHALCSTCVQRLCVKCDGLFHSHPERKGHSRTVITPTQKRSSVSSSAWACAHCGTFNKPLDALCTTCKRSPVSPNAEWQCKSCTVINQGSSVLCEVCERPRLAPRPSVTPLHSGPGSGSGTRDQWTCQFCTFVNTESTATCKMCSSPGKDPGGPSPPPPTTSPSVKHPAPPIAKPIVSLELKRQERMREDGLKLIHQIKEAEKRGISPEEVYAAIRVCDGSSVDPYHWQASELPHLLDEICAMAASVHAIVTGANGDGMKLSRAEARLAWLATGGDTEQASRQLLRDRQVKMRELHSLGFRDVSQCEEALRQSGGEVKDALSVLQRPLLDVFHKRMWSELPEPPIDPKHPDKERMCRRLLALYDLPSWGRCELTLSLLQEPDVAYTLEDVVQAVRESHDRDFIRRVLNNECPCCFSIFPHSKMQSLTSCQCSVCQECFTQHFTITVRDKHIRDMVCPICREPDINDPEQLDSYFSTLDIQLRECLTADVYELFHKKLTEHALMKDPKFLWCCHCTSGFINEGDQLKVTCLSCCKSFCAQCKKPWEPLHQDLSCEQFQQWKRDNDPEYQRKGLAGYLRDNGITCPHCRFQYALTKGGCMHFSCSQCRYQFCSGCNNPYYKMCCRTEQCNYTGLHAHHPRDCLFYLRDWEAARLQALLQRTGVDFNTDPSNGQQTDTCGVMEQKDEGGQQIDSPCGIQTQPGHAGLCEKHYREYLVSLINAHSIDPAPLYETHDLIRACERYQVDRQRGEGEDDGAYHARLLKKLMEVPLGEKVPRNK